MKCPSMGNHDNAKQRTVFQDNGFEIELPIGLLCPVVFTQNMLESCNLMI